jgi:hypothetical protein
MTKSRKKWKQKNQQIKSVIKNFSENQKNNHCLEERLI